ncbi:c-type cytochrome biogenesis protein CcmI [Emcibacter sp.]|uniref:c-type cytochrome biogenesis protein CcmI n=1 Tax=Emcibacter sp. TaxID=1979954 RepID=UPI002AA66961|nr:c-type cytochrome biogenesis protein CcmI [Emcibacter sp.]
MYWALMAVLLLLTLAFVLVPLLRGSKAVTDDHPDVVVYKAQLAELEEDVTEGRLSESEVETARLEIQRRLLKAADRTLPDVVSVSASPMKIIVIAGLTLACSALYLLVGTPGMPDFPSEKETQGDASEERQTLIDYVARIRGRLAEDPAAKVGWLALGQFENRLGNFPQSAAAFERAWELDPDNFDLMLMYMESLIVLSDGKMSPASLLVLEKALAKNPDHPGVQYYVGLVDYQSGKKQEALSRWKSIVEQSPPDAPWTRQVQSVVAMTERELGLQPQSVAPAVDRDQMQAVQDMAPEDQQQMIRSMVRRLADRLEENPEDGAGWQRLGRAWQVLGERKRALEAYKKALIYSPESDKPALEKELEKLENSK